MNPSEAFETKFAELIEEAASHEIHTEDATVAIKNLETFSKCRPEAAEVPEEVPTDKWGRIKYHAAKAWDNETTRVSIKAAGALAGTLAVVAATIRRDHVLERDALNQSNQKY